MISHDLRSPLTALHGTLDMLAMSETDDQPDRQEETLSDAQKTVETLVHLMNDFLDLEKFESGTAVLEFESIPLSELIDSATEGFVVANDLSAGSDSVGTTIKVDKSRMILALRNLLSAAGSSLPPEGRVVLAYSHASEDTVEIEIRRSGAPMSKRLKESNFSRYILLPKSDVGSQSSSGVGLALAMSIVRAHGGSLSLKSGIESDSFLLQLRN